MSTGIDLQQINAATLKFLEPINLHQTFETITRQAITLLGGCDGFILLTNTKGELQKVFGTSDYDIQASIQDVVVDHPRALQNFTLIPLFYKNKCFGTLIVQQKTDNSLTEVDMGLLNMLGSLATLSIRKAQLYEENQKALKIRDLFTSMAAHELKTPLTTIGGYAQLLESRLKNKDGQESEWVKNLVNETKRMNGLINDMLQTHNIKSGKLQFKWQECHLTEILQKSMVSHHFSNPKRVVNITSLLKEGKDIVIGDCDKLQQVFDNILDNAGKFSSVSSPIQIDVYAEEPFINIEVIDKGTGILKKDLPYVFDEFFSSSNSEHTGGMGLGLYLVKMIVTEHHGKIQISSSKKGTKVTVRLRRIELT